MVSKPLIRPYYSGGGTLEGGRLTSHDIFFAVVKKLIGRYRGSAVPPQKAVNVDFLGKLLDLANAD